MPLLRFWLRHPGPCFVLVGGNLVFASTFDDPGPISVAALSAFLLATLTQGLRLGWQASRSKTVVYTCLTLLPLAIFVLFGAGDDPGRFPAALGLLSPVPLAALVNRIAGPPPPRGTPPRARVGCLMLLTLAASYGGWFVYALSRPGRWARATRDSIRAGMTLAEAVAAPQGLFLAVGSAQAVEGSTALSFGCRGHDRCWLSIGGHSPTVARSALPAALRNALGERAVIQQLTFHFRGRMLPLTTSFDVEFDPQGRVSRVSGTRSWD